MLEDGLWQEASDRDAVDKICARMYGHTTFAFALMCSAPLELVQLMTAKANLDSRKRCLPASSGPAVVGTNGFKALQCASLCHSDPAVLAFLICEYPLAHPLADCHRRHSPRPDHLHPRHHLHRPRLPRLRRPRYQRPHRLAHHEPRHPRAPPPPHPRLHIHLPQDSHSRGARSRTPLSRQPLSRPRLVHPQRSAHAKLPRDVRSVVVSFI